MNPLSTSGIMNKYLFRGFIIRYNSMSGTLSATPEGNDIPLLFWKDPEPLQVAYFGFATWQSRTILVAFDCHSGEAGGGKKNFLNEFVFLHSIQYSGRFLPLVEVGVGVIKIVEH